MRRKNGRTEGSATLFAQIWILGYRAADHDWYVELKVAWRGSGALLDLNSGQLAGLAIPALFVDQPTKHPVSAAVCTLLQFGL